MSREMVNSGIPWIGDIPKDWNCARMKQLGTYINGYAFKPEDWSCSGKPIIRIQDLTGSNNSPNYYEGDIDDKYLIKDNDILVSWAATLDAFIWKKGEGWLNQHIFKAVPNELTKKDFFFWLLKVAMVYMNNDNKHGIVMQHITTNVFGNFIIPLPSLTEQQKIASFLDKKCAEIEEMITLQEKIIEELKAYKQSVITEAVTKGLNPNVPMKESGIEWVGQIPAHWEMYRIKYNTFLKGRIGWQGLNSSDFIDEGYCLITGTDFDNKGGINWDTCYRISKERFDEDELLHIKNGDLLMTKDGTVGKLAYVKNLPEEASLNSHLLIIRQTTELIDNEFLYWVMLSNVFKRFCLIHQSGSIMSSISQSTLGLFNCYFPTKSEQKDIVDYLNVKCTEIDNLISIKQQKIEHLKEYKKSIIYEYVTGKKELED